MSKYKFILFCKTYKADFKRFILLKKSIDNFNLDNIPFCIVCPKSDIEYIKVNTVTGDETYDILFYTDEEIINNEYENHEQNWYTQQVVKLVFYKKKICDYYLMLDSDCYFIQNFEVKDFFYDQTTIYFPLTGSIKNSTKYASKQVASFNKIKTFLGLDIYYTFVGMPTMFISSVLEDLEKNVLVPKQMTFKDLIQLSPYELVWHNYYVLKKNYNIIVSNPTFKVYNYHRDYIDDVNHGVTIKDLQKEGFLGVCLNNGWVNASIFKPHPFQKIITFYRSFFSKWHFRDTGFRDKLKNNNLFSKALYVRALRKIKNVLFKIINKEISKRKFSLLSQHKKEKKVLIIEPNICHFELLPSRANIFIEMGFFVDIISAKETREYDCFSRFNSSSMQILYLDYEHIVSIWNSKLMKKYEYVVLNTTYDYRRKDLFFNIHPINYLPKKTLILGEHSFTNIKNYSIRLGNKILVGGLNIPQEYKDNPFILPLRAFYLGNIDSNIQKDGVTTIVIPGFNGKSLEFLIKLTSQIVKRGHQNFEFIVVDKHFEDTECYQQKCDDIVPGKIKIAGKVSFETLFEFIESAHFLFSCLDPENENHERYKTISTTGSLQISFASRKPLIIEKSFADFYELTNATSLVYETNNNILNALEEAIEMTNEKYKILAKNIFELGKKLELSTKKQIVQTED